MKHFNLIAAIAAFFRRQEAKRQRNELEHIINAFCVQDTANGVYLTHEGVAVIKFPPTATAHDILGQTNEVKRYAEDFYKDTHSYV